MARKINIRGVSYSPEGKDPDFPLKDEWVCIVNQGSTTESFHGWVLANRKPDGKLHYGYYFPALVDGRSLTLKPGQMIFLNTGQGRDCFLPAMEGASGQFHLYYNKSKFIWNQPGDKICLFSYRKEKTKEIYELIDMKELNDQGK